MSRIRQVRTITTFCGLACLLITSVSNAQFAWYYGKISRIFMFNGGFVLTMESAALNDCKHSYVYFKDSQLGEATVNRAYSMALSGQATGKLIGVVIDKAINGVDGYCDSNGSVDIKD